MAPIAGQTGVPRERVVAVEATLADGRRQMGSGFLVDGRLVLTAEHCTRDKETQEAAVALRVVQAGAAATAPVIGVADCPGLDVAVLTLGDDAPWDARMPAVVFARVDRRHSGMLENCEGIGFPLFQREPEKGSWNTSEVHGTIYQTDEAETGRLLMREPLIRPGHLPVRGTTGSPVPDSGPSSPWGGLSGALLFHAGMAIGVVVEHHPRQGDSALRAIGFDKIAKTADTDPAARRVADALGLPARDQLPWAAGDLVEPLAGLVDPLNDAGDLPLVRDLNPYLLGATPTQYGSWESSGVRDPYVQRTHADVDTRLLAALEPGRMVLLVGPSKAGKTRTAFEAIRTRWPQARLLSPDKSALAALARHPRIQVSNDEIVVWLDDLQEYLAGIPDPLTPALLTSLLARPGQTVVMASLRNEERALLVGDRGELTKDVRRLLERATQVELGPTSEDPAEQAAADAAYPAQDLSVYGLAEQLAGAPALLNQYRDARYGNPLIHAVIQMAVDWARVGMSDPLPEEDLTALALDHLEANRPDLRATPKKVRKAIETASTPPAGAGRVAVLETVPLPGRTRGYRPFSYLVAADDGQTGRPRPIPDGMWDRAIEHANPDAAFAVGIAAYYRKNPDAAMRAMKRAANAGHTAAMAILGILLAEQDPPDLEAARSWYERAANAGHTGGMVNLGKLLSELEPPDLDGARTWFKRAAAAGETNAMGNLGILLARQDPPDLEGARTWYQLAAAGGHTGAMVNLGKLLSGLEPPDLDGARSWYQLAAAGGHTGAMVNFGKLLSELEPPDLDGARSWYQRAAAAGETNAMLNLGILLTDRQDPPDLDGARTWYQRAAAAGETNAMLNLGILLTDRQDPPDLDGARTWYQRAADAGNRDAMLNLGILLSSQAPPADGARTWYQRAADAGHTGAMINLGILLTDRQEPPDLEGARTWYQRAADAGNTDAMVGLGILLSSQAPPDLEGARTWYQRAADAGNTDAMRGLGILLSSHAPPDLEGARTWYQRAAEAGNTDAVSAVAEVSARMGDAEGARAAWRKVINSDASNIAGAALALAALDAMAGNTARSVELLDLAGRHGATSAPAYGAVLNPARGIRNVGRLTLGGFPEDSDALNFLGIASYLAGEPTESRRYWVQSIQLGDVVAPLLLRLTDDRWLPG